MRNMFLGLQSVYVFTANRSCCPTSSAHPVSVLYIYQCLHFSAVVALWPLLNPSHSKSKYELYRTEFEQFVSRNVVATYSRGGLNIRAFEGS